jgi:hypothetical protein
LCELIASFPRKLHSLKNPGIVKPELRILKRLLDPQFDGHFSGFATFRAHLPGELDDRF